MIQGEKTWWTQTSREQTIVTREMMTSATLNHRTSRISRITESWYVIENEHSRHVSTKSRVDKFIQVVIHESYSQTQHYTVYVWLKSISTTFLLNVGVAYTVTQIEDQLWKLSQSILNIVTPSRSRVRSDESLTCLLHLTSFHSM